MVVSHSVVVFHLVWVMVVVCPYPPPGTVFVIVTVRGVQVLGGGLPYTGFAGFTDIESSPTVSFWATAAPKTANSGHMVRILVTTVCDAG